MRLKVVLPTDIVIDKEVIKVIAEAENGSFCLLPRHIGFVSVLVPGLLSYVCPGGQEEFVAVDKGILVKCGPDVVVSTGQALAGADLGMLKMAIEKKFNLMDERQKKAQSAVAKLEASLVRRFLELERHG
ncbi:MAG: F0F1 ATP synthase subunit epsilon [Deltaproteobacteria bacterium]|nr:F0F1 ATP synthase subunit epsilon [Deltaproteobacteria bacterium]